MPKKKVTLHETGPIEKGFCSSFGKRTGSYVLILKLDRNTAIPVGRLGAIQFPTGYYIYAGSAFGPGGLKSRVGRHLKRSKKCRWHIDYLRRFAEVKEIWYTFHPEKVECRWSEIFQTMRGVRIICPGFGSSDCRCESHLFFFIKKPGLLTFRRKTKEAVLASVSD